MNENDLRAIKTEQAIHQVFDQLLIEKEFEKISVKELCEKARISRKTFYAHYSSLDELLTCKQNQMSEDFIQRIQDYKIPEDLNLITRDILSESWKETPFQNDLEKEIAMTFVSQSTLAIYRKWIEQGKRIPLEKIIEITSSLVSGGLNEFLETAHKENPSRG